MGVFVLSLFLFVLVAIGVVMGRRIEGFANMEKQQPPQPPQQPTVSPALANLLATPALVAEQGAVPQVDVLSRDKEIVDATNASAKSPACPKCPKCPDMSQYVRLDEVPCWNCTLP